MKNTILGAAGLLIASTVIGSAADMPLKAAAPIYAAPVPYNWSGFYVGANFGVGASRNTFSGDQFNQWGNTGDDTDDPLLFGRNNALGSHVGLGPVGGFQAGYNYQVVGAPIVLGIEGMFNFASLKGSHQNSFGNITDFEDFNAAHTVRDFHSQESLFSHTKDIATIAGRFGVTSGPQDRTMWFVKGGAAWKKTDYAINGTGQFQKSDFDHCGIEGGGYLCEDAYGSYAFNSSHTLTGSSNRWGYVLGTGVEFGLWGNWTTKIEYDFMDFGNHDVALAGTWTNGGSTNCCSGPGSYTKPVNRILNVNEQIHMITVGINYKFDWGKQPVVARY